MQENKDSYNSGKMSKDEQPINAQVLDIHALADDQLGLEQRADTIKNLSENPVNFREYLTVVKLKAALQKHCGVIKNETAWEDISQNIQKVVRRKQYRMMLNRSFWVITAGLVGFMVGVGFYNSNKVEGALDVSRMSEAVPSFIPISTDAFNKSSRMGDIIPRIFGTPPIRTDFASLSVNGIGTGVISGKRIFKFNLQDDKRPLILFIGEGVTVIHGKVETGNKFTYWEINNRPYIGWNHTQYIIILTGNRSKAELRDTANKLFMK